MSKTRKLTSLTRSDDIWPSRSKMNFSLSIVLRFCEFEENVLLLWWSILRHLMQWGNWVTKTDKGVIVTSTNHELGCNSTHARFSRFSFKELFPALPCSTHVDVTWVFYSGFWLRFFFVNKNKLLEFHRLLWVDSCQLNVLLLKLVKWQSFNVSVVNQKSYIIRLSQAFFSRSNRAEKTPNPP